MAKNRNRNKSRGGAQLLERARRELAKGNAKTAVKEAEACFRQDPRPECRTLLEQAYLGRVEQLHRLKMPAEARAILRKLLDMKPSAPEILDRIPRLQVVVGDAQADEAAVLEQEPELLIVLADQAVLDPRALAPQHGGVAAHVQRVREAFAAIERGDDGVAVEALRELPRSSPLGDWKLFLRGLSSFYLGDVDRAAANWQRLDPKRPAFRIGQTLLVADGHLRPDQAAVDVTDVQAQLEARIQASPAAAPLNDLAEHWRAGNWSAFFRGYRQFRQRFAKGHAPLVEKIVDLMWKHAVRDDNRQMLERLEAIGPAPALDPRWNRAWALGIEHASCEYRFDFERHWQNYIEDLATISCLREDERPIAVGLVHHYVAKSLLRFAALADRPSPFPWYDHDPEEGEKLRHKAARRLRQAIESCPRLTAAHRDLARFHEEREEEDKAAAVWRRLVEVEPDDFDARLWLANYHLARNEPGKSEAHVEAVLRLRPRDPQCTTLRWNQRVTHIRGLAIGRKFAEARREVEQASENAPEGLEPFVLDAMRAAVEFKAKHFEAGQRHLEAALRHAGEPAAVWMIMSGTAAEYRLPRNLKKDFDNRFKSAIEARPTSRTAGLLAALLLALKLGKRNYTGRATQERLTVKYLGRAKRIAWKEADLKTVCRFLDGLPRQQPLQAALVAVGLKQFPNNPHFHYWRASDEVGRGMFRCNCELAQQHLLRALELARASDDHSDRSLIPLMEQAATALEEMRKRTAIARQIWEDDEDDEDDENDENDGDGSEGDGEYRFGPWARQMSFFGADDDEDDDEDDEDDDDEEPLDLDEVFAAMSKRLPPELIEAARRALEQAGRTNGGR